MEDKSKVMEINVASLVRNLRDMEVKLLIGKVDYLGQTFAGE